MLMLPLPSFQQAPNTKVLINIGAGLDVPTGYPIVGIYKETIINGGLGMMTGVIGMGNNFKTTMADYMQLSAMARIIYVAPTNFNTYDTEINVHESKKQQFTQQFPVFQGRNILNEGIWCITDKTLYAGDEYYEIQRDYLKAKRLNTKIIYKTPFPDRSGKKNLEIFVPTFSAIDSFTEFETSDVAKIQEENELGSSDANMIHQRQGLAKTRFLMDVPALIGAVNHCMLLTAHVGKVVTISKGPVQQAPDKKLQYIKNGDKAKGVTDRFYFLMSNCWHAYNAAPYINKTTFGAEYPREDDDKDMFSSKNIDADLNKVSLCQVRSKSGPTGYTLTVLVSQSEGVLPGLTEFEYIKDHERFGLNGNNVSYSLDLLPDVKLSRTTVRGKLDKDLVLQRAMNITSEMCQIKNFWRYFWSRYQCTPKQLYDELIAKGYDWNILLNTRGWWTLNNEDLSNGLPPFLSTPDLLKMRVGEYHPYWLAEDKKTIIQVKPK
jgi:hypothetical protein